MSVNTETASAQGQTTVLEKEGVYASLFEKINLTPASSLGDINAFMDDAALSDAPAGERLTAAMQVFMDCIRKSGQQVEKLDKTLIDHHIAELDYQISRQLDAVMHHQEFQKVESLWRGLKQLVDNTDYRDVHWRLVWEDTRYCDGIFPDESEYFLDDAPGKRITCPSGELCPHSGHWATIAGGHQQFIDVQAGQLMPEATKYQSNMYADEIHLPAIWSLLRRHDEGSVYVKTGES